MTLSIIIPVYKNKEMLLKNLKHNYPYLRNYEIILVDDASGEDIRATVEKEFPKIKVIENMHNLGFGSSVNRGVEIAHGSYLFLLNTDVLLSDDSFLKAINFLNEHQDYFGVSFKQREKDGKFVGKNAFYTRHGFILNKKVEDLKEGLNGWAEGGCSIIRASYFRELKGFDTIYKPFYHEDNDLSYRAYKREWRVLFDPQIIVEHHHESTIRKYFTNEFIKTTAYRNHFIFMWKNMTDQTLLLEHIFFLPYYFIKHAIVFDAPFFKGFVNALGYLGEILQKRTVEIKETINTDKEVLATFKKAHDISKKK